MKPMTTAFAFAFAVLAGMPAPSSAQHGGTMDQAEPMESMHDSMEGMHDSMEEMHDGMGDMQDMHESGMQGSGTSTQSESSAVSGTGVVNTVDRDAHSVNLSHEPIGAIGWPAMTMDMDVADDVDLSTVEPGAPVTFTLQRGADGIYMITGLEPAK